MIRILTDSGSDLSAAEAAQPGVSIVPMSVVFEDGTSVKDGVDITREVFYEKLATCSKLPRTSQPSPEDFMAFFEDAKQAGDSVVAILIASALSGTYQCAKMAAAECDFEDVYFVDSLSATAGEGVLIREALRLRAEGKTMAEIGEALDRLKERIYIFAVVDSLHHLHKGGRLPAAVALVGGALGIKPVLKLAGSKLALADKARGRPGAYLALFKQVAKVGGVDPRYGYTLLYSSDKMVAGPIHHYMHSNLHLTGGHVCQIGATIGTHIGPGAAGICFVIPEDAVQA